MPTSDDGRIGARIKEQRRLARLSQRELAAIIPYSYSLLNQVECGARPATGSFVASVAAALGIDPSHLQGPAPVTDMQQGRLAALMSPIREALDLYDLLDHEPAADGRPVAELAGEADRICRQVRATHLRAAARALPEVIAGLTVAAHAAPETATWQALASTYRTAHDIALKVGYPDLAVVALDRMGWAAERASDPCLAAIRQYKRALGHAASAPDLGRRMVAAGQGLIADDMSREALAVAGQLHLGASAVAARTGDGAAVEHHIAAAREMATRVGGEAREVHWLSFGQMNVSLHEMGAAITMRRYDQALQQARTMKLTPSTVTSRRARFLVDRASVEMETGHTEAALRHLVEARRAAPEQTRYHPRTRETISGLLHTARRTPDTLGHMAAWIGL
ncbi:helix-turn-helix domain-containing protein [Streptomyces sp. NBC_01789]|uniref:helix-turn-helix domain-containing protein n=1 Tax=Streptomyces sp. NBC_01789 TaxID=2975941 RepID=UPI002259F793|nr:helix-turn-helix domain-containing protein [Streptomyces sp. NBC_01789]MCX4450746.1 helix-turn-helix domain-containing protein [Streptomyces sp. NBC_01789]